VPVLVHRTTFYAFLTFALCASFAAPQARAQTTGAITAVTDNTSVPVPNVGHEYIQMLDETVNPANGSVSVRIQVPTPPGRKLSLPFSIAYDSSSVFNFGADGAVVEGGTPFQWGGWSYSLPQLSMAGMTTSVANPSYQGGDGNSYNQYVTCDYYAGYIFRDPKEISHELYLMFWNVGGPSNDSYNDPCGYLNYEQPDTTKGGDEFFRAISPNDEPQQVYVADLDGTTYTFNGPWRGSTYPEPVATSMTLATSIEDRNGNILNVADNGGGAFTITDTLQRPMLVSSGFGASGNTLQVAGLSNPYSFQWAPLSANLTINGLHLTLPINGTQQDPAITSITLPNNQQYHFQYDPNYGLLTQITYPTGAYVSYVWGINVGSDDGAYETNCCGLMSFIYNTPAIMHRYVSFDGVNVALQQDFSYSTTNVCQINGPSGCVFYTWTSKQTTVTTHDLVRGTITVQTYNYSPMGTDENGSLNQGNLTPIPVEQTVTDAESNATVRRSVTKTWGASNILLSEQVSLDGGPSTLTKYYYGLLSCYNPGATLGCAVPVEKDEFDFNSSSNPLRKTVTNYTSIAATPIFPWFPSIVDRPSSVITYDANGNRAAETDYTYDGATLQSTSNVVNHDYTNYSASSSAPRGNATTITSWTSSSNSLSAQLKFDDTGQVVSITDPANNTTTVSYSDNYTVGTPPGPTNAYLTGVTFPTVNNVSHTESFAYGYEDGHLMSSTDENGQPTSYQYNDPFDRLTKVIYPPGGGTHTYAYQDYSPLTLSETQTLDSAGDTLTKQTIFDNIGHPIESLLTSDPNCASGDRTDSTYDGNGRVYTVSNPYCSTSDPTYGITSYLYDAIGRTMQVTNQDGTTVTTTYASTTAGSATEVTDEGNGTRPIQRISQVDALGRLVSVCEVTNATQAGSLNNTPAACNLAISGTGFLTSYTYNSLNDLLSVSQGGNLPRTFTYDWLSRLLTAANPEAGTLTYTYDLDPNCASPNSFAGDLVSKLDARGVRTCVQYDALHRMTQKNYTGGPVATPTANFYYDQCPTSGTPCPSGASIQNPVGRLVESSNSNARTFESYDQMGRVANEWQCTPVNCASGYYPLAFGHNYLSDLTSESNGLGVTVSYGYDTAAHLISATSSLSDSNHPANLVNIQLINALGLPVLETLGSGVTETATYTPRTWLQSLSANGPNGSGQPATAGTGSATISGSEQSVNSPGTPGTGTVTISGSERSKTIGCPKYCNTVYDTGTVTAVVNGHSAQVNYNEFSSPSTLATALAQAINNATSTVTASANGAVITITATSNGASTDYTLSASSAGTYQAYFSGSSFSATASGSTLTGGTNGSGLTYDTGTVWVTVHGHQTSASYGQGDTSTSVASHLASAINSDSGAYVTASASGTTVSLTSKQTGASSNYSLSAGSSTNQPSLFSSPSFSVSASGSALTGGANAVNQLLYSFSLGFAPNGDILSANDSVNGDWTYTYDDFNRLLGANQNSGAAVYSYAYDRFGNRWQQNGPISMQLAFDGNNHIAAYCQGQSGPAYTYDAAGNLTYDCNHTYTYDAENRVVQVSNNGTVIATYAYDADGQRVEKNVSGAITDYVYGADGNYIAEVNASGNWTITEVYAGGRHLATYSGGASGTTYFIHSDWLGTERARTTAAGAPYETCTSLPFGDGLSCSGASDPSPLHFTGKERDPESGLDNFHARYDASSLARFVSPDWSAAPMGVPYAKFPDPQSLNLYAYVRNNPVTWLDADGHAPTCKSFADTCQDEAAIAAIHDNNASKAQAAHQARQTTKPPLNLRQDVFNKNKPRDPNAAPAVQMKDGQVDIGSGAVTVSASGTAGNITASTTRDVTANVNTPTFGASVDITIKGPKANQENLGEVSLGMKHLGVGTNVVRNPDGHVGLQGVNVHVGASVPVPSSPITYSTPPLGTPTFDVPPASGPLFWPM
jgi:RHS repeat-associated protein